MELSLFSDFSLVQVVEGIKEMLPETAGGDHAPLPGGVAGGLLGCYIVQSQSMATLLDRDVFPCKGEAGGSLALGCAAAYISGFTTCIATSCEDITR